MTHGLVGIRVRERGDRRLDLVERGRVEQVDPLEREAARDEVHVRVVEAGEDGAAPGIDLDGAGLPQAPDLA